MSKRRDIGQTDSVTAGRSLLAVSPLDGRYARQARSLERYFSELALLRYRLQVEVEWYISLGENPMIPEMPELADDVKAKLRGLYQDFGLQDGAAIKEIERQINHDVKALEYLLRGKLEKLGIGLPLEMVHFACTSEDINNLAYALSVKEFVKGEVEPRLQHLVETLGGLARQYKGLVMLARTHGQAATPTTLGKELAVFAYRLRRQLLGVQRQEYLGKANGAVGNYNAHYFAYPEVDWIEHSQRFVEGLGLTWSPLTTQIESHDYIAELSDSMGRISTILIGFSRDMWGYVSQGYLKQGALSGEVGSSTMPHKVNPIDFENCEGNLGLARALFVHMSGKLPISRWQRDLSDSTVMRNIGTAFGYFEVAMASLERGLSKVAANEAKIREELEHDQTWEVVGEAIQTMMRRHGIPRAYETLKELTRGRAMSRDLIRQFIESLPLDAATKSRLAELSPASYSGLAQELVARFAP